MVDGAARAGTVAALSHWPATPTPEVLRADLSAQSALLVSTRRSALPRGVDIVTVDHLDEDAAVAVALLCVDGLAARHGPLLVESARVGDFGVVTDRRAACVAFALAAMIDPVRTPTAELGGRRVPEDPTAADGGSPLVDVGWRTSWVVDQIDALVSHIDGHRHLWAAEMAAYDASVRALDHGVVEIVEDSRLDLAVVRLVARRWPSEASWAGEPIHRAAVHTATSMLRVATVGSGWCQFRFRYETWVRLASFRPKPRVDLSGLCIELDQMEGAGAAKSPGARWVFDGASALVPVVRRVGPGPSAVDCEVFVDLLRRHLGRLDTARPAWDPYR